MARKKKEEEHENLERWLISYSDFITLLFALFVVLFAITNIDLRKLREVSKSIQFGFTTSGTGGTGAPPVFHGPPGDAMVSGEYKEEFIDYEELAKARDKIKDNLFEYIKVGGTGAEILNFKLDDRGLIIRLSTNYFFNNGDAGLHPAILPVLDNVAAALRPLNYDIRVEGHTDSIPVQSEIYSSNWELSSMRATNVVKYLVEKKGFLPSKVSAAGYAAYHPIDTNAAESGRAKNRRIDIVVLGREQIKR
ncbi:MAG: OmpA family protein [Nitrospinae bacterium]|nr:OmpA family protein [Nitrospinota bacterium]MBI3814110.1 OmpA family protein [Nitrospinota bacterium]